MKVKTNLRNEELELVGKGLQVLAKAKRGKALPTENQAEKEMLRRVEATFEDMLDSLEKELKRI